MVTTCALSPVFRPVSPKAPINVRIASLLYRPTVLFVHTVCVIADWWFIHTSGPMNIRPFLEWIGMSLNHTTWAATQNPKGTPPNQRTRSRCDQAGMRELQPIKEGFSPSRHLQELEPSFFDKCRPPPAPSRCKYSLKMYNVASNGTILYQHAAKEFGTTASLLKPAQCKHCQANSRIVASASGFKQLGCETGQSCPNTPAASSHYVRAHR